VGAKAAWNEAKYGVQWAQVAASIAGARNNACALGTKGTQLAGRVETKHVEHVAKVEADRVNGNG
jgi:hypothetical protein